MQAHLRITGEIESRTMKRLFTLLIRALALRCPICGKGNLFCRPFLMHENCPCCHYQFEREEGYFSGAMALAIIVSEFIIVAIALPIAFNSSIPLIPAVSIGAPLVFLLPILLFHHSRSLWLALDLFWHPLPEQTVAELLAASCLAVEKGYGQPQETKAPISSNSGKIIS